MTDQPEPIDEDVMVAGRDMLEMDEAFIYSTWRNGYFYGHTDREKLPPADQFFREQTAKIKDLLQTAKIRVACLKGAPEVIIGYAVLTGDLNLEWVFVKHQFRGRGVAKFICVGAKTWGPPITKPAQSIFKKKNLTIREFT